MLIKNLIRPRLPEVPKDTSETNALMRNDNFPALNELDIKKVQNGFQKLSINYDNDLNNLLEELASGNYCIFENRLNILILI